MRSLTLDECTGRLKQSLVARLGVNHASVEGKVDRKTMKKIHILGVALVAALAFGAIAVSSAFAETPEWLLNGKPVESLVATTSEGEVTLDNQKVILFGHVEVKCSGILDGNVNLGGVDEVTKVLSLITKLEITELGGETGLECVNILNCPEPLVFPVKLPWATKLATILQDILANAGWSVVCMGNGLEGSCEGKGTLNLTNGTEGVVAEFNLEEEELEKTGATCTQGGEDAGFVQGTGTIVAEGGTLSVS
jgi:hypothetical protein